jgi:hypothetical protein
MLLATVRRDGRPQSSPVTGGVHEQGRIVISTYSSRAKARNVDLARQALASVPR